MDHGQRQKHHICKSITCGHLPNHPVIFPGTVISETDRTAKRILIIISQDRSHLRMRSVKPCRNTFRIQSQRVLQQPVRCFQNPHDLSPSAYAHGIFKFPGYFPIRDKRLFLLGIITKIPKMNQQRQHVVSGSKRTHVILKTVRIDTDSFPSQHPYNIRPQTVKIHFHIDFQRLIGLRGNPIIGKVPGLHRRHNRPRIIHMFKPPELIPVIPAAGLGKIHIILSAQLLYLSFRKTRIFLKNTLIRHGIFPEHIQSGMLTVFFHRENTRHISQCHIGLILQ